eukprot:13112-Heterococcus_DN1.PRE.9
MHRINSIASAGKYNMMLPQLLDANTSVPAVVAAQQQQQSMVVVASPNTGAVPASGSRTVSVSLVPASSAETVDATTANYTLTATTPLASPRSTVHHAQQHHQHQQQQQQQQRRNSSELVAAAIGDAVSALSTTRDTVATASSSTGSGSSGDVCRLYVSDATHPGYPVQCVDIKVSAIIIVYVIISVVSKDCMEGRVYVSAVRNLGAPFFQLQPLPQLRDTAIARVEHLAIAKLTLDTCCTTDTAASSSSTAAAVKVTSHSW